jgi:hypothetical protein
MVAQGAPMGTRFLFKAFMYQAGEKDFEFHHILMFDFRRN